LTANSTQWFIDEYLKKQTIPILRQFGDAIQAATGAWLGLRSSERKAELLVKCVDLVSISDEGDNTNCNKDSGWI
jgi:hypothetical protein